MATLYVTSSADSGDGTLRDCVTRASDGDVIRSLVPSCTIANALSIETELTFKGLEIVGSSNATQTPLQVRADCSFVDCKFYELKKSSSGGCVWIYNTTTTVEFTRCYFTRNYTESNGSCVYVASGPTLVMKDCLLVNNLAANSSAVYFADPTPTATIQNCTFADNCNGDINRASVRSAAVNTLLSVASSNFVNPADNTDPEVWSTTTNDYDYYLDDASEYVSGATTNDSVYDLYGNFRSGSVGAIERLQVDAFYADNAFYSDYACQEAATIDLTTPKKIFVKEGFLVIDDFIAELANRHTFVIAGRAAVTLDAADAYDNFCADFTLGLESMVDDVVGVTIVGAVTLGEGATNTATVQTAEPTAFVALFVETTCSFSVTKTNDLPVAIYRGTGSDKVYLGQDLSSVTISDTSQAVTFTLDDGENVLTATATRTYYYKGNEDSGSFATPSDWALDEAKTIECVDAPTIPDCVFIA